MYALSLSEIKNEDKMLPQGYHYDVHLAHSTLEHNYDGNHIKADLT